MVALSRSLATPPEIVAHLDRHVIGQARAKRQLAMAAYRHYLAQRERLRGHPADEPARQHQLLLGPTGVGKTLLVRTLSRFLGVPVVFVAAPSLVETGYVGMPVEAIFQALLERAGGDVALAEQGIVFLDELDKLRRAHDVGRDVSGEGVQNGLLTLLDGRVVRVKHREHERFVDSSRVLFLCTGAFAGLPQRVRARLERESRTGLGFASAPPSGPALAGEGDLYARATSEDLVAYGFIPELIGRFAGIVPLAPLTAHDLERVLCEVPGAPLRRTLRFFQIHGVELDVTPCARSAIVERAMTHALGARALERVVHETFAGLEYRLTELEPAEVACVRLTREVVFGEREPEIVLRRERRAPSGPTLAEALRAAAPAGAGAPTAARERPSRARTESGVLPLFGEE